MPAIRDGAAAGRAVRTTVLRSNETSRISKADPSPSIRRLATVTVESMPEFTARKIIGKWREGFALDLHTMRSEFIGHDEFGHPRFETERSPAGELLYRLKYGADRSAADGIAEAVQSLLQRWKPAADILVPVPPSTARPWQPVSVLADAVGQRCGMPVVVCVTRTRDSPQLKNVFDLDERLKLLENLHAVDAKATQGRGILLFDDLYRSGATMNAITEALYDEGKARDVFALTVTRTRSIQ